MNVAVIQGLEYKLLVLSAFKTSPMIHQEGYWHDVFKACMMQRKQ